MPSKTRERIRAEILTGKPPYVADDSTQVFRMASRGKLDDCFARLEASDAEAALVELSKTALSPEPEDRVRDAGELAADVTCYLEGVQERLRLAEVVKERRRKQLYLAVAGFMVLLACSAAGGSATITATLPRPR